MSRAAFSSRGAGRYHLANTQHGGEDAMKAHWHILGAGAIGCLWAAHLAKAGHQVSFIVRNAERQTQLEVLPGLTLEEQGKASLHPVVASTADNCGVITHLLVTTKAYDTHTALLSVQSKLSPGAQVVVLQNGMGAQQAAAELLAPIPVWAASTTDGAWLRAPFHVVFAGRGETRIGPLHKDAPDLKPAALTPAAPLKLVEDADIEHTLWRKLAINCAINPLTVQFDCPNGALASDPEKRHAMAEVCAEIESVALHLGMALFPQGLLAQAEQVATATAANFSSMLQDVRHHRPTELAFITGYLLNEAHRLGLTLPCNQQLYEQVKAKSEPS